MKVVYVAGPFRGSDSWQVENNIRSAENAAFLVACLGAMPMCPHTMTRYFDGTLTDSFWLDGTMELLRRCDAIYMTGDWENSSGSVAEKAEAERLGLPVLLSQQELALWIGAEEPS